MPTFSFECDDCGREFFWVVKMGQQSATCPHCGSRGRRVQRFYPVSLQVEDDPAKVMVTPDEIDRRIGRAAEDLRGAYGSVKQDRNGAQKVLGTPHVVGNRVVGFDRMSGEDIEYRKKVERVMKAEPEERLKRAGMRVIKARRAR